MTVHPERRAPVKPGAKRRAWSPWVRAAYRALNTAMGMRAARLLFGVLVFGVLFGGVLYWTIKQIDSEKAQGLEQKMEQVERENAQESQNIERRLDRVEKAIQPIP